MNSEGKLECEVCASFIHQTQKQWQFLAVKAVAWYPTLHAQFDLVCCDCVLFSGLALQAARTSFLGCPQNSGNNSELPTCDSKHSILASLSAIAKTLDPFHKFLRGLFLRVQQRP